MGAKARKRVVPGLSYEEFRAEVLSDPATLDAYCAAIRARALEEAALVCDELGRRASAESLRVAAMSRAVQIGEFGWGPRLLHESQARASIMLVAAIAIRALAGPPESGGTHGEGRT